MITRTPRGVRAARAGRAASRARPEPRAEVRLRSAVGLRTGVAGRGVVTRRVRRGPGRACLTAERPRWTEKRLTVPEARIAGEMELGRSSEYVHELIRLVPTHPPRERPAELLMTALYRSGRSSDALLAYEDARRRIADAVGADPGPAPRAQHERILRQDPGLLTAQAAA
ncbi:BTAD domain-containing putative transcriptional regulator [Streptomyces sp. NPDC052225]|uniref:AfsR/SARP family transcriptional regulator n=1 Tax=Streptomyces sp. NPDC052225 TaxID=3154949 RepID=UPI003421679D